MRKINNENIHFFDLDNTLWKVDSKVWIIDKENSHKPILRIDKYILSNILNGIYFKDDIKINYNSQEYYIPKELYDKILKKRKIPIENIGLSWIEFYDSDYINNSNVKFLYDNIKNINTNDKICILTGRSNRNRHSKILNLLRKTLEKYNFKLFKIYFVSDYFHNKHHKDISIKKSYILLEHLLGIKIENNRFISIKQDWFSNVYFYDDEIMNIEYANNIQSTFDRLMAKTEDDIFLLINNRIKNNTLKLTTNLITNNELNPYKKNEIVIKQSDKFIIEKNFNNFIN